MVAVPGMPLGQQKVAATSSFASSPDSTIETQQSVVDVALDYHGKRLATCGETAIYVYEVSSAAGDIVSKLATFGDDEAKLVAKLEHPEVQGPLQQLCWSDPTQGSMIAACGLCGSVVLWREQRPGEWTLVWKEKLDGAATSVQIGPKEFGLFIAAGSSSGLVSIFEAQNNSFTRQGTLKAHQNGVASVCWAAPVSPATLASGPAVQGGYLMPSLAPRRVVTAGFDNNVKVWRWHVDDKKYVLEASLSEVGEQRALTPDELDKLAKKDPAAAAAATANNGEMEGMPWKLIGRIDFGKHCPVWRVGWSVTGLCLSVSCGEDGSDVRIYKEDLEGEWRQIG
eukprot:g9426.t1